MAHNRIMIRGLRRPVKSSRETSVPGPWKFVESRDFQRKDESWARMDVFSRPCVSCGKLFSVMIPHGTEIAAFPSDRCKLHDSRVSASDFVKEKNPGELNPLPPSFGGEGGFIRHAGKSEEKSVAELLVKAQTLTARQRQELLDQLSLANKMTRSADQDRDLDMWATAVYEALTDRVASSEPSGYGRLLVKQLLAPSQNWRPVQNFMEESRLCELKVVERASVYFMLAELLVKHAERIASRNGAPLGPKLVGSCAHGIAGVFDQAFPGYLRAGLAKIAARQLVASRA